MQSIKSRIGRLVSLDRHVTPDMASGCVVLLLALVQAGLKSGVLQSTKVEQALRRILALHPCLVGPGEDTERLSHDLCNHVQAVLAVMRYLRREESCTSSSSKHSRTNRFRRAAKASHWIELQPILEGMVDTSAAAQVSRLFFEDFKKEIPGWRVRGLDSDTSTIPMSCRARWQHHRASTFLRPS